MASASTVLSITDSRSFGSASWVGGRWANAADYLQHGRVRRNTSMCDVAGSVSAGEARELRLQAEQLLTQVGNWLRSDQPALLP